MGHNTTAAHSLQSWYAVHGTHDTDILATSQVHLLCHNCEVMMTADEVFAGFDVSQEAAIKADSNLVELNPVPEAHNA